jgi:hypothetical protein
MNALPPQFDIPVHPSCVQMSERARALGKLKIIECKNLLNRSVKRKKISLDVGIKKADEQVANGGTAKEYIAYLRQLKREQGNDY